VDVSPCQGGRTFTMGKRRRERRAHRTLRRARLCGQVMRWTLGTARAMEWPWRPGTARNKGRGGGRTLARATAACRRSPRRTVLPNLSPDEWPVPGGCGLPRNPHGGAEPRKRGRAISWSSRRQPKRRTAHDQPGRSRANACRGGARDSGKRVAFLRHFAWTKHDPRLSPCMDTSSERLATAFNGSRSGRSVSRASTDAWSSSVPVV
jgi:hypothetical protein